MDWRADPGLLSASPILYDYPGDQSSVYVVITNLRIKQDPPYRPTYLTLPPLPFTFLNERG